MSARRILFTLLAGLAALSLTASAFAQTLPKPFVLYEDELKNGWQSWSWAKVDLSYKSGDAKPMRVKGDPWSALALHHEAFSTEGFSKLTFYINGGMEGEQALTIKATVDGKPVESNFMIKPKAKTWSVAEVSLKELGVDGKKIDGIIWQGQATAFSPFYITRIQLE